MRYDIYIYTSLSAKGLTHCNMMHGTHNVKLPHLLVFSVKLFNNPLNAELNPIRHLLASVEARHIVHVSRISVNRGQESM